MALVFALPAVALSEDEVELVLEPEQEIAAEEQEGLELEVDPADDPDLALDLPDDHALEIPEDML